MNFMGPDELYYSLNGEWIYVDENLITAGLTAVQLLQLGEVLFLDLPDEGKFVKKGESFFSIESANLVHDFFYPVSGTIIEVNQDLLSTPGVLNDDPFGQGWIIKIEMDNEKDLATLIRYDEHIKNNLLENIACDRF